MYPGLQAHETTKDEAGGQSDASRRYRKQGVDVNWDRCGIPRFLWFTPPGETNFGSIHQFWVMVICAGPALAR